MINKKEIKKQYKQTLTPMGIFQIKNLVNGKIFIGSSKNLPGSINKHKFALKLNSSVIPDMQKDYNQVGEENFTFEVIDTLSPKEDPAYDYTNDLLVLEELWLEKLSPYNERGYNKLKIKK
jgi:hypothetical protein